MADTLTPQQLRANTKLVKTLEASGFSPSVVSFVMNAASNPSGKSLSPLTAITAEAQSTIRQLVTAADNATGTAKRFNGRRLGSGLAAGTLATALLLAEGSFATYKTQDNYASSEEAATTNFARVAVATGTTTLAAGFLSKRGMGNKLMGLLSAAGAVYSVGSGTALIATEQMEAMTLKDLKDAENQLAALLKQEESLVATQQNRKNSIYTEIETLNADRTQILSANVSETLITERDNLKGELSHLRTQLSAYEVKAGSAEAQGYISQGYTNVGINADGDASNDDEYHRLKIKTTSEIAEIESRLNPLSKEISKRQLNAGGIENLSESDKSRISTIDKSIAVLRTELSEISGNEGALEQLRAAQVSASQLVAQLQAERMGLNENLFDRLEDFIKTEDGLTATTSGATFGMMSLLGGLSFHHALNKLSNKGTTPAVPKGAITIAGIPISSLGDNAFIAQHKETLESYARMMTTGEGVENALQVAGVEHLNNYKIALQTAFSEGALTQQQFDAANKVLSTAQGRLPVELRKATAFVDNMTTELQAGAQASTTLKPSALTATFDASGELATSKTALQEKIISIGKAAKAGRIGANITGIGGAIGVGATGLLAYFHTSQRAYAATLHDEGILSDDAYLKYEELNKTTQAILTGDVALSTLDPTGLTMIATLAAEGKAEGDYKSWYDTYAPHLKQGDLQALSMSVFSTQSLQADMLEKMRSYIPTSTDGQPAILHAVIEARREGLEISRSAPHTPMMAPMSIVEAAQDKRFAWQQRMDAAQDKFHVAMVDLTSDPKNMNTYLNLVPVNDRLEFVKRLAKSEQNPEAFARNHPEIANYIHDYGTAFLPSVFGTSADDTLIKDPTLLNNYIMAKSGISTDSIESSRVVQIDPTATNSSNPLALAM